MILFFFKNVLINPASNIGICILITSNSLEIFIALKIKSVLTIPLFILNNIFALTILTLFIISSLKISFEL